MIINFIICDDQEAALNSTKKYVERSIRENETMGKIALCSTSPQDVLEYCSTHSSETNVYILDINFNEDINGLGMARYIRQKDPNCYIIFITAHVQLSMMTFKYKLKVFDFLVKPISWHDIDECIKALQEDLSQVTNHQKSSSKNLITVTSGYQEYQICVDEIVFIESFGPKLTVHMTDGVIETYSTLKEFMNSLNKINETFQRVHKSFVINRKYIKEVNLRDMEVTMITGDKCPLSRGQKSYFMNKEKKAGY